MRIAERIFGRPLAITQAKLGVVLSVLGPRLNLDLEAVHSDDTRTRQALTNQDNVAVISVTGSLVNRSMGVSPQSGMTSYEQIAGDLSAAVADPTVKGILLDIDSSGGEVAGLFDLVDRIKEADSQKPVVAAVNDEAYSAAYAIASAAREIYTTKTGGVGSIGVVAAHVDQSKADADAGLKVTYIYEGARKVDGNPHEPLSDEAHASIAADVEAAYHMFVSTVAANRSRSLQAIQQTEAACFYGQDGIDAGLADGLGGKAAALESLAKQISVSASEKALMAEVADLRTEAATLRSKVEGLRTTIAEMQDRELAALVDDLRTFGAEANQPLSAADLAEVESLFRAGADNAGRKLAAALKKTARLSSEKPFVRATEPTPTPAPSIDQKVAERVANMQRGLQGAVFPTEAVPGIIGPG